MEGKVRILNLFLLILGSIAKSGHVVIETINYWATIDIIYIATKNGDIKQQSMGIKGTDSPGFLIETDRWKFTCDAGKNLRKSAITSGWVDQPFKGVDGGDNHLVFTGKDKAGNHLWIGLYLGDKSFFFTNQLGHFSHVRCAPFLGGHLPQDGRWRSKIAGWNTVSLRQSDKPRGGSMEKHMSG